MFFECVTAEACCGHEIGDCDPSVLFGMIKDLNRKFGQGGQDHFFPLNLSCEVATLLSEAP